MSVRTQRVCLTLVIVQRTYAGHYQIESGRLDNSAICREITALEQANMDTYWIGDHPKLRKLFFLLAALCVFLPFPIKRLIYLKVFEWEVDRSARIGLAFIWAKSVKIGPGASIGHFTVLRNLDLLELNEKASVGNWCYGTALNFGSTKHFTDNPLRNPSLMLGKSASITGRHYLDCNDAITIGEFTTVAGRQTLFYTHGINIISNRQECAPISIGRYCIIGARCMIVKGAILPDYSVLGAQSVLSSRHEQPYGLYAGNPATLVKSLSRDAMYFTRTDRFVD